MNVEGIFALAVVFCAARHREAWPAGRASSSPILLPAVLLLTALAFLPYLSFPLLADDYTHIHNALLATPHSLWAHFTIPETDHFFRPAAYLSYALDATWAGTTPVLWRISNLVLHLINTWLVYQLCLRLRFPPIPAAAAALLFGIHGSRPEVVTWVAARFDLLAVLFGLLTILTIRSRPFGLPAAAMLLAALSKESAYVVPLLAALVLWFDGLHWREIVRRTVPIAAVAVAVFVYRWWLLGGIGGYRNVASGNPTVFSFRLTSTLKGLFPRFWGTLVFPVNWTGEISVWFWLALALGVAGIAFLAWQGADRRRWLLGFGFATICSLPVHQFLSIGPDLEKSRVLYFASIGFAMLFGAMTERRNAWPAAAGFLIFQFAALEHNLAIWKSAGNLAQATCRAGADLVRSEPGPVVVLGLPNVLDGVYFLHTGFEDCVEMQTGQRPETEPKPGARVWIWDDAARKIQPEIRVPEQAPR